MDIITGYISKITFRNEENGFSVLTVFTTDEEELTVVGTFPDISEGENLCVEGERITHPVYGEQIKVHHVEFLPPTDAVAVERYLGSGLIKGIGKALAKRIVKTFGDDTFRIMETEPERLIEVKGISERLAMSVSEQIIERREMRSAILYLQSFNVSLNQAVKIYREYEKDLYAIIRENPYRLAEDIDGIGFRAADEIAKKAGVRADSEQRIMSAIIYILTQETYLGHTYYPYDLLFSAAEALLSLQISDFENLLQTMMIEQKIHVVFDGTEKRVYLRNYFLMEAEVARMLSDLNRKDRETPDSEIEKRIRSVEKESGVVLEKEQRNAVFSAARYGVTIITGGPGTGKTTTINTIIRYFISAGLNVSLAAPTGRAAKRMTETSGYEASTIHRLLEVSGDPEARGFRFGKNGNSPLEADVIIIDEVSMVDLPLFQALLRAMVSGMRLVLSGDADQLPSVGPGEVLRDLIRSERFSVVRLNHIFRQHSDSDIILNAHKINEGEIVEARPSKDFLFVLRDRPGNITGAVSTLLREKLPKYVNADVSEIQVLTPGRKGGLGVLMMNPFLQNEINPPAPGKSEKKFQDTVFREGDKVMQIKNDYQMPWRQTKDGFTEHGTGIYNGDMGIIERVSDFEAVMTVRFDDDRVVEYPYSALDELELAYAVTIHKSQGSEYPAVIIPLFQVPELLRNRNLLYTGVTRAKKCVVIVGSYDEFCRMIENSNRERRYTGLLQMLLQYDSID